MNCQLIILCRNYLIQLKIVFPIIQQDEEDQESNNEYIQLDEIVQIFNKDTKNSTYHRWYQILLTFVIIHLHHVDMFLHYLISRNHKLTKFYAYLITLPLLSC
jgi:hypothetical protein